MAIAKKGKRKIVVDGRLFYWYVAMDEYAPLLPNNKELHSLTIVSDDRKFSVCYLLSSDFITIQSKEFVGDAVKKREHKGWWRVRCPVFLDHIVTPQTVANIIKWCLSEKDSPTLIEVDWNGRAIEN